jgi:hypothetical protein
MPATQTKPGATWKFGDMGAAGAGKSLTGQRGVGFSGRIRTEEGAPTPAEADILDPELGRS